MKLETWEKGKTMTKTVFLLSLLLSLLIGCTNFMPQPYKDYQTVKLAIKYAKESEKCAPILKKHPEMISLKGNSDVTIFKDDDRVTQEEAAYQRPIILKFDGITKVTFWHNGHAYDSTSYFIDVYLTPEGSLQKIEVREEPGGLD